MARLILHIGAHKTATTSVQKFFKLNRQALAAHGVAYPLTGKQNAHYILAAPWISAMERKHGFTRADGLAVWRRLDRRWADHDGVVFLSSEAFCRQLPERVDFAEVAELTRRFESVEIVYVVRNQLSALQSFFMQISRNQRNADSFAVMMAKALESGPATPNPLRHSDLVAQVEAGFPNEAIRVANYELLASAPGGVIGYFLGLCGLPPDVAGPTAGYRANVSADPLSHLLAAERCAPETVRPEMIARCREAIEARYGAGVRTTMFTRDEIQTLRSHFEPLNAHLATRIAAKDEYAGPIDLPAFDGFLTRDQLDDAFLSSLPRANDHLL